MIELLHVLTWTGVAAYCLGFVLVRLFAPLIERAEAACIRRELRRSELEEEPFIAVACRWLDGPRDSYPSDDVRRGLIALGAWFEIYRLRPWKKDGAGR